MIYKFFKNLFCLAPIYEFEYILIQKIWPIKPNNEFFALSERKGQRVISLFALSERKGQRVISLFSFIITGFQIFVNTFFKIFLFFVFLATFSIFTLIFLFCKT